MLIKSELLLEMLILRVLWQTLKCVFPGLGGKKGGFVTTLMIALQRKHIPVTSHGALTWISLAFSSQSHCTWRKRNIHFPFLYLKFSSNCWCGFSSPWTDPCILCVHGAVGISFTAGTWEWNLWSKQRPIPTSITFPTEFFASQLCHFPFLSPHCLFLV